MKIKTIICAAVTLGLIAGGFTLAIAADKKNKQVRLEAQAKISKADAEKAALAKVPGGKVKEAELEEEDGTLIWSFDITKQGSKGITGVEVDAKTGEVLTVEQESVEKEKEGKKKKADKEEDDDEDEDHEDNDKDEEE